MKIYIFIVGIIFFGSFFFGDIAIAEKPTAEGTIDYLKQHTSLPEANFEAELIPAVIRFLLSLFAVFLTGVALYAGYLFVVNFGNEEEIEKAKKLLMWAIVGIVIAAISYALVQGIIHLDFSRGA